MKILLLYLLWQSSYCIILSFSFDTLLLTCEEFSSLLEQRRRAFLFRISLLENVLTFGYILRIPKQQRRDFFRQRLCDKEKGSCVTTTTFGWESCAGQDNNKGRKMFLFLFSQNQLRPKGTILKAILSKIYSWYKTCCRIHFPRFPPQKQTGCFPFTFFRLHSFMARARFYARGVCRCAAAFPFGMNFILSSSARSLARFPLTWAHSQSGTRWRRAAKDDASQIHTEVTELMHHDESAVSKRPCAHHSSSKRNFGDSKRKSTRKFHYFLPGGNEKNGRMKIHYCRLKKNCASVVKSAFWDGQLSLILS